MTQEFRQQLALQAVHTGIPLSSVKEMYDWVMGGAGNVGIEAAAKVKTATATTAQTVTDKVSDMKAKAENTIAAIQADANTKLTAAAGAAVTTSDAPSAPDFTKDFKPMFLKLVVKDRAQAVAFNTALATRFGEQYKTVTEELFNANTGLFDEVKKMVGV